MGAVARAGAVAGTEVVARAGAAWVGAEVDTMATTAMAMKIAMMSVVTSVMCTA